MKRDYEYIVLGLGGFGSAAAYWLSKNPALVTLPLSLLAGILVSLLAPEPDAAAGFTRLERQTHLGTVAE